MSIARKTRVTLGCLLLAICGSLAWFAHWGAQPGALIPGFAGFLALFGLGLALPYVVALALIFRGEGRVGVQLALAAALINSIWLLPLAGILFLFAGFTLGNRDQEQALLAIVLGALLQVPLGIVSGLTYRRNRKTAPHAPGRWAVALCLPLVASGSSWGYFEWQTRAFGHRMKVASANDDLAKQTARRLQVCLWDWIARHPEAGYPASLDVCRGAGLASDGSDGFRYEYVTPLPDDAGRITAYQICALPIAFRATGFESVVVDQTGSFGSGIAERATLEDPPTCASSMPVDRAIVWCANRQAAQPNSQGYPARLAQIADCVGSNVAITAQSADWIRLERGEVFAYIAGLPDAQGKVAGYRVHRLRAAEGTPVWIDQHLGESEAIGEHRGPPYDGLPDQATPERFEPGCGAGRAEDCRMAGYEWERRAFQTNVDLDAPELSPLFDSAIAAYSRGCKLGDPRSCVAVASELEDGRRIPRDVIRAAALFEQACDAGEVLGCRHAANLFERGRKARPESLHEGLEPAPPGLDLQADVARAVALFERACALGDEEACFVAGRILAAGEGIPADPARALRLHSALCDQGMPQACSAAAQIASAPLTPAARSDYRRRACILSEESACP